MKTSKMRLSDLSEAVGDTGRKWVLPNETIFVGQLEDSTLLIIGDEEDDVGQALQLLVQWLLQ